MWGGRGEREGGQGGGAAWGWGRGVVVGKGRQGEPGRSRGVGRTGLPHLLQQLILWGALVVLRESSGEARYSVKHLLELEHCADARLGARRRVGDVLPLDEELEHAVAVGKGGKDLLQVDECILTRNQLHHAVMPRRDRVHVGAWLDERGAQHARAGTGLAVVEDAEERSLRVARPYVPQQLEVGHRGWVEQHDAFDAGKADAQRALDEGHLGLVLRVVDDRSESGEAEVLG